MKSKSSFPAWDFWIQFLKTPATILNFNFVKSIGFFGLKLLIFYPTYMEDKGKNTQYDRYHV